MKKYFILFVGLIFTTSLLIAQDVTTSLLWKISGNNLDTPSYLYGTMHLIPEEDFYFPESLQNTLKESDVLVMEIGGLSQKMKAVQFMMLDSGSVYDYFTENQLDSLFKYTNGELGLNKEAMMRFSGMKPIVLLQLLTKNAFGDSPKSFEMEFEKIARSNEIEIKGLETIEEQMSFFNDISIEKQVEMVMQHVRDTNNEGESQTKELIKLYKEQNIGKLHKFIAESSVSSEKFENVLLNNRNKDWIQSLIEIISKKRAFIAVGAGHLGGEKGVVNLLIEEGYKLTPIKF